jgi:hypothetical protein
MQICSLLLRNVNKLRFLLRYKSESHGLASRFCHWNFFLTEVFRRHYRLEVDSTSNRNSTRNIPWSSKGGRCVGLTTLPSSCAIAWNSGSLELLVTSGSVQTCTGIALPLPTLDTDFINQQQYYNCTDCDVAHAIISCDSTVLEMLIIAELFKEFPSLFIKWNSFPFQFILTLTLILSHISPVHNAILFKVTF